MSVLAHVAPKELQQSIFMHADSLDSYNKVRTYIKQCLSAQFAETTSGRTVWRNKLYQTEGKSKRTGPNGHWGSQRKRPRPKGSTAKAKRTKAKEKAKSNSSSGTKHGKHKRKLGIQSTLATKVTTNPASTKVTLWCFCNMRD